MKLVGIEQSKTVMIMDALAVLFELARRQWCPTLHAVMCMCLVRVVVCCSREKITVSHDAHAIRRCETLQQACARRISVCGLAESSARVVLLLKSMLLHPYGTDGMRSQATVERWLWTLSCGRDGQAGETDIYSTTVDCGTVLATDVCSSRAVYACYEKR